jgi:hypothetical protein
VDLYVHSPIRLHREVHRDNFTFTISTCRLVHSEAFKGTIRHTFFIELLVFMWILVFSVCDVSDRASPKKKNKNGGGGSRHR